MDSEIRAPHALSVAARGHRTRRRLDRYVENHEGPGGMVLLFLVATLTTAAILLFSVDFVNTDAQMGLWFTALAVAVGLLAVTLTVMCWWVAWLWVRRHPRLAGLETPVSDGAVSAFRGHVLRTAGWVLGLLMMISAVVAGLTTYILLEENVLDDCEGNSPGACALIRGALTTWWIVTAGLGALAYVALTVGGRWRLAGLRSLPVHPVPEKEASAV